MSYLVFHNDPLIEKLNPFFLNRNFQKRFVETFRPKIQSLDLETISFDSVTFQNQ